MKRIDKYEIYTDQKLGSGSFGTVYKAKDDEGNPLAVKCLLKKKVSANPSGKQSLIFQIETMRSLDSENVVRLHDILQSSNYIYLVLEYCEEGDLRQLIRRKGGPFSEQEAVAIVKQVINAFSQLSKRGIVHRDLKPENILLKKGQCKLADFGLAKVAESQSALHQTYVGTPLYSCPQILSNKKYSSKCDIWSLACIYCELLSGKPPFQASSIYELMQKVLHEDPVLPAKLSPKSLDYLLRSLKKEQEERLSWEDIYNHPLFSMEKAYRLSASDSRLLQVLSTIHRQSAMHGLNLVSQLKAQKIDVTKRLPLDELALQIMSFFPDLCFEEALHLGRAAAQEGGEQASPIQLVDFLKRQGVPVEGEPMRQPKFREVEIDIVEESKQQSRLEEKAISLIKALKISIDEDQLQVERFIQKGSIVFPQFRAMMQKVSPGVHQQLVVASFQQFDPQFRGQIELSEFQSLLRKIGGPFKKKASIKKGDYQPTAYFAPIKK